MRTSERGMSRAVFFPPRGENYTAKGALHTCGVVLFDRSAAMQHSVMIHLFAANTNVQHRKEIKSMLKQHTNQITVVHIPMDMFLNHICRKEETVCRTQS